MNTNKFRKAVYAGSFDPPTNGHLWMIQEAQSMFDELVVAIGINPEKKNTYNIDERIEMLQSITKQFSNVKITSFKNLFLVDYASSINAQFIIRGIRSVHDYEYERSMRHINSDLMPSISTIFLIPPREYAEVSSTMIKTMVGPNGWKDIIKHYLPQPIYLKIINENTDL